MYPKLEMLFSMPELEQQFLNFTQACAMLWGAKKVPVSNLTCPLDGGIIYVS